MKEQLIGLRRQSVLRTSLIVHARRSNLGHSFLTCDAVSATLLKVTFPPLRGCRPIMVNGVIATAEECKVVIDGGNSRISIAMIQMTLSTGRQPAKPTTISIRAIICRLWGCGSRVKLAIKISLLSKNMGYARRPWGCSGHMWECT